MWIKVISVWHLYKHYFCVENRTMCQVYLLQSFLLLSAFIICTKKWANFFTLSLISLIHTKTIVVTLKHGQLELKTYVVLQLLRLDFSQLLVVASFLLSIFHWILNEDISAEDILLKMKTVKKRGRVRHLPDSPVDIVGAERT